MSIVDLMLEVVEAQAAIDRLKFWHGGRAYERAHFHLADANKALDAGLSAAGINPEIFREALR